MEQKEIKNEENSVKEQKNGIKNLLRNRQTLVIVSVIVFVFLLAAVPILIHVTSNEEAPPVVDTPDTGEVIDGTYSMSLEVGSSKYIFDGNKVTNIFGDTTIEYTYVIAVENGVKVIKLTTVDKEGNSKTTTHEFETGSWNGKPLIRINGEIYYSAK